MLKVEPRRAQDRLYDAPLRAAAAEMACKRRADLGFARVGVRREKSRRSHDDAIDAIAALHHRIAGENLLQGMRAPERAEPFERDDPPFRRQGIKRNHAGPHGLAVDMNRTGAALAETAAVARRVEIKLVAQRKQERHARVFDFDRDPLAIDP